MKKLFKRTMMLLLALFMFISPINGVLAENVNEAIVLDSDDTSIESANHSVTLNNNLPSANDAVNRAEDIKFTQEESEGDLKISIMSDTHVLPTTLIAENDAYTRAMHSDRKLFTQSQGIFDEAINLAKKNDSEIIMIAGDLTKDGERQSHEYVSQNLEKWKEEREASGKKAAYFVIPGNHDINNYDGYDFTTYNEETDKAELAGLTTHKMFNSMYSSLYEGAELYINSEEYKNYMSKYPNLEEGHGSSSYAKHIDLENAPLGKSGLTVIGIDTTINTEDVTPDGRASHITSGTMGEDLYQWAKKQIIEAKKRNDIVFLLSHHGYIPHFVKEPELLKEYLLNEWDEKCYDGKRPAEAFADLGVSYVFTGHMHAQDIAKVVSKEGNTIYDIETGSTVTYPCPIRHISLKNAINTLDPEHSLDVKTELIKNITYTDPKGGEQNISDLTKFAKGSVINEDLLVGASGELLTSELYKKISTDLSASITGLLENEPDPEKRHAKLSEYLWDHLGDKIIPKLEELVKAKDPNATFEAHVEGDVLFIKTSFYKLDVSIKKEDLVSLIEGILTQVNNKLKDEELIKSYVQKLAGPLLKANITDAVTVEELANYAYLSHLAGDEKISPEMQDALKKINDEGAIENILKQIQEPLSEIVDDFTKDLKYNPMPSDAIDFSKMPLGGMVKVFIKGKIGSSVKRTLIGLKFLNKKNGKYTLDLDRILAIDAVKGGLTFADGAILDIVDAFTSEDQAAYQEYSYKEDNNTKLSWRANLDKAEFTAAILGNKITVLSTMKDAYTGKLLQDGQEIALDENHTVNFAYDKEFTIKLERVLPNGYTLNYTSNNVLIKENTIEPNPNPNPNPQPEPNPDNDNTIIIPPYEPDNRDEHSYRPRRPRPKTNVAKNEEEKPKTIETKPASSVVNEVSDAKPIIVNDKILPVNFTDIVNERRADAIKNLAARGVLQGMGANKFMPNLTVTRAMIAEVLMRISRDKSINSNTNAKDIKMGDWYYNSVKWGLTHNIIKGYNDGTFKPNKKITRQELASMLERLLIAYNINMPSIVAVDSNQYSYLPAWSRDAVMSAVSKGLLEVNKDGKDAFDKEVSRADFAYAIDRIVEFVLNN